VRAVAAHGPVGRVGRELGIALVALVVRRRLDAELVARISVRIIGRLGTARKVND
jgi:hypothetical protein